ncbi:MAG: DegV family protein [Acidimicrobiales bacterium]
MIRVVTDGAADLPPELATRLKIEVVRGPVRFGADRWHGAAGEFWEAFRRGERLPTTEAPSVDDLVAAYRGDGPVMAIHVSSELSQTLSRAEDAAGDAMVEVVDSRSLSVGTGLVAMAAGQAVEAGVEWERLRRLVGEWVDEVHLLGVIDDVGFLVRGGRAGLVAARVSKHGHRHVLAVKGHVIPLRQVRHRAEAVREMVAHAREHVPQGASRWALGHGDARDIADVAERLVAVFGCEPAFVTLFGAPVGSHMGPGAVAVAFLSPH